MLTRIKSYPRQSLAVIVLVTGLVLTGLTAYFAYESSNLGAQFRFQNLADEIRSSIEMRQILYLNSLVQMRGLIQVHPNLSREDFKAYTNNINLQAEYPGIMGLGYIEAIQSRHLAKTEQKLRADYENPDLEIWSATPPRFEDDLYVVRFFEPEMAPVKGRNIVGFNSRSDPVRQEALDLARDTGKPVLTKRVHLIQDPSQQHPGFLLTVPIYRLSAPIDSLEGRRAALIGFVYSAFRVRDLFDGIIRSEWLHRNGVEFEIYDGALDGTSSLHESLKLFHHDDSLTHPRPLRRAQYQVEIGSHTFTLVVFTSPDFESLATKLIPSLILVTGFILSFVAFRMLLLNNRQAEQIVKSEKQLRLVTDSLPVLISYIDTQRHYRFNNRAYEKWFSVNREESLGRPMPDVIGARNYELVRPYVDRVLRGEAVSFEAELELNDGSLRPVQANYVPDLGPRGAVRGFATLISDISDQRRSEDNNRFLAELGAVLAASLNVETTLERFASLLTPTIADWCAVDLVEDGGKIRSVATCAADPGQKEALERLRSLRTITLSDPSKVAATIRSGEPTLLPNASAEDLIPPVTGQIRQEELCLLEQLGVSSMVILPLRARNRVLGAVTLVNSKPGRPFSRETMEFAMELSRRASLAIDNAQLYTEAQRANQAKDEFLATLSHELRTPMNVILGWLEILSTESVDQETYEQALATLNRNAMLQIQLINDLLDISRIISGKLPLNMQRTDLTAIVRTAVDGIRPAARAKNIELKADAPKSDLVLYGDPDRIQQVLWNLLSNAVKFTSEGGTIEVGAQAAGETVQLTVRDTGQGIDPHFLPYVFDRFRQEDGSTTRSQGGLGLGLSIVRYLVELHGGSVSAHSDGRDKGASFTATFPRRMDHSAARAPQIPLNLTSSMTHRMQGR